MVDTLHGAGIGVIVDWVPAHFPSDAHGLARFDGTALYEHEDPRLGFHKDWNTLIYNFGRTEVSNFLRASAIFWLQEYRIDALRVDAVASMLYLDYSRDAGEWVPNVHGGRENLEAIEFLKRTNEEAHRIAPGSLTIAEESTAFPGGYGAGRVGRARLRLQVEHGVDERHPALRAGGPGASAVAPPPDDVRPALRFQRGVRAADQP